MSQPEPPTPRISVVIPHLNQPGFLRNCLKSLHEQNFDMDAVEIIVVDNGSKALPEEICNAFPGTRLALETQPGPGPARNRGIALARAPLLAFIDADCLAGRNWLATISSTFDADPALQIIGGDVRIAVTDPGRLTMLEAYECVYAYRQKDYIERQGFSGTGNLAMRRGAYDAVGPFAGIELAEDRDWGKRATVQGFAIHYIPGMIVFHPARTSLRELCAKWDRQIAHDYAEQVNGPASRLRWVAKAAALALSPAWETVRIARSDRIRGLRARWLALRTLVRVRVHRVLQMGGRLRWVSTSGASVSWNR